MADALNYNIPIAEKISKILNNLGVRNKGYLVATVHRQSNTDIRTNLKNILYGFHDIDWPVVFPVHPRTIKFLRKYKLIKGLPENVSLIPPLGYLDMLKLMAHAKKIVTDSGGIQKEAYLLKIPCITLRENTEWVETINEGWNILAGTESEKIRYHIQHFNPIAPIKNIFGNGDSASKIVKIIKSKKF